jgi:hypothetical protein
MMPFVMSCHVCMLPEHLEQYWRELIVPLFNRDYDYNELCDGIEREIGEICYLTIQESYVERQTSQRRPGLHTDNPGKLQIKCDGQCIHYHLS